MKPLIRKIKPKCNFYILQILDSGNTMTTEDIVQRIIRHRLEFEERNSRKEQKEIATMKKIQKNHIKQNGNCEGVKALKC